MQNSKIADMFEEVAVLLRISEDNEFHARAYDEAARIIRGSSESFENMVQQGVDIKEKYYGIGEGITDHIKEIVSTEKLEKLEKLRKKIPPTLVDLTKIRGVGPQTAKKVWKEANVTTIDELDKAAKTGQLRDIKGFGKKTEENILEGVQDYNDWQERTLLSDADKIVDPLLSYLKKNENIEKMEVAGSWRRRKETVGDIDILVIADNNKDVINYFTDWEKIKSVESAGETKSTILLSNNFRIDLRVVAKKAFGAALCYFTGSKAHNIRLRSLAREKGLSISEYGVFEIPEGGGENKNKEENRISGEKEQDVYDSVELPWIPPELREDRGEIKAAEHNNLPSLIKKSDIKGDLQMHTEYSDGNNSIKQMAEEAIKLGYEYIAITDHSQAMTQASGMDPEEIQKQWKEIEEVDEELSEITILKGAEVDILKDGSLDLPDEILKKLDVVLISVHQSMRLDKEQQTKRILKAFENPYVNIFSHPTSRKINERKPIEFDLDKILKSAQEHKIAIECNAQPFRLDLNDLDLHYIKDKKMDVKIAINTDSHNEGELSLIRYGINQARRGWIEKEDVINTFNLKELKKFLNKV